MKEALARGLGIGEGEGNATRVPAFFLERETLPFLAKSSPFPCAHRWLWLYFSPREEFQLCQFSELIFKVEKEADGTERVNRLNNEMCVLQALREKVRTKEIWVVGANRFRNPDDDLPTDFEQNWTTYYDALYQPHEADQFIEKVKTAMQAALRSLDAAMPRLSSKVRLLPGRKKAISLTPLESQPEPRNLISLKREVVERWSNTNLLDFLKETALRTNFLDYLTSVASRVRLPREVLHRRLLLCLYGLSPIPASNAYPVPIQGPPTPICATCAAATSTKSNFATPLPTSPMPF